MLFRSPTKLKSEKVIFGATVTFENEDGEHLVYQIVGEDEIDIVNKRISWKAPLAAAALGKKLDDEVKLQKPTGEESLTIIKIEFK